MQVFMFHLMPWPHLPADYMERYDSAWVTFPNSYYDPVRGHELYNRYLDELEYAERLGFDGVGVNEHHQNAYGTMPSPNLMAAMLCRRLERAKILILGNALPLRDHPQRIAEEVAMLDNLSRGRVISGFVRGIGCEYLSFGINPADSRERFLEAHDLVVRAWTEPGPFAWHGKHYEFPYVNTWPRPYQRPHPPIWLASQGSFETIEYAAERRYPFIQSLSSVENVKRSLQMYREHAARLGYEAAPEQLGWSAHVYVAESAAQAREEAEPHLMFFFNKLLRMPRHFLFPPAYLTEASAQRVLGMKSDVGAARTMDRLLAEGQVIVGTPKQVRDQLLDLRRDIGFGQFLAHLQYGDMPADLTRRNMELFAREVLPHLRAA
jgi:alkanesulfonate monooxygenase SsuD/methylene tetrahydromethanopterin reductase-like flavin-dependent oxidoreductase (luciferase family)